MQSVYPINQSYNIEYEMRPRDRNSSHDVVEDEKEAERRKLQRRAFIISSLGVTFLIVFFILVKSDLIVLSGKYRENDLKSFSQRIEFTLRYQALGLLFVGSLIGFIATRRLFTSAIDPTSNNEEIVQKYKNILQNSLEQFVLSSITQLVLASNLSAANVMTYVPFMSITFFIGRIIYLFTYPNYRAFGFLTTFVPTHLAIVYCAINVPI